MIEPINFVGTLRKRWRLVVVLAVIGAVIALVIPTSTVKHPKTVLKWQTWTSVGAPAANGLIQGTVSNAQIQFVANTFPVKLAAVADVGLKGNPYVYAGDMFATTAAAATHGAYPTGPGTTTSSKKSAAGSGYVTLFATGPTQQLAAALANAYYKEVGNGLDTLVQNHTPTTPASNKAGSSTPDTSSTPPTGYVQIFPGTPELAHRTNVQHPSSLASHKVRLVLGLVLGVLAALLIILIREVLDKSIRRSGRAEHHFNFPVIATIPETYPPDPGVVDLVDHPTSPASEAYRKLRMSVMFEAMAADAAPAGSGGEAFTDLFGMGAAQGEPYKVPEPGSRDVLLVASTADEPSRAKVVANLAATYAEAGEGVIIISTGDLEVGTAFSAESIQSGPVAPADVERWMTPAGPENVWMLSMRHFMRNSGQLVSRAKDVLDAAREVASVVIVEAPAFLRFHHGEALVHSVDAVVVVVENGETQVGDARDMGDILRRLGAPVLGVVYTGEALSKGQKRAIDQATAVPGRSTTAVPAVDDVDATVDAADDAAPGDGVDAPTPELHPS